MTDKIVPYDHTPISDELHPTSVRSLTTPHGSRVEVGRQKLPDGDLYVHRLYHPKGDGTTSELTFSLSPDACLALAVLYESHGLLRPFSVHEPKPKKEKPAT